MTEPVDPRVVKGMTHMGDMIDTALNGDTMPREFGFVLLVFEFGTKDHRKMNYMSNAERVDMLCALKELVANFEGRAVNYQGEA